MGGDNLFLKLKKKHYIPFIVKKNFYLKLYDKSFQIKNLFSKLQCE